MNRRDRRAADRRRASVGDVVWSDFGSLQERDPNYGLDMQCYVCAAPHKARGVVRVRYKSTVDHFPLCQACVTDPDQTGDAIARKVLKAPDLICHRGGELSNEQVQALLERGDASQH